MNWILHCEFAQLSVHQGIPDGEYFRNDIALIRLDESVPLYNEDPTKSFAMPVCLPWPEYDRGAGT